MAGEVASSTQQGLPSRLALPLHATRERISVAGNVDIFLLLMKALKRKQSNFFKPQRSRIFFFGQQSERNNRTTASVTQRVRPRGVCGCPAPRRVLLGHEEAPQCFLHLPQEAQGGGERSPQPCPGGQGGPGLLGGRQTPVTVRCVANGVAVFWREVALAALLQVLRCTGAERQAVPYFSPAGGKVRGPEGGQQGLAALLRCGRRLGGVWSAGLTARRHSVTRSGRHLCSNTERVTYTAVVWIHTFASRGFCLETRKQNLGKAKLNANHRFVGSELLEQRTAFPASPSKVAGITNTLSISPHVQHTPDLSAPAAPRRLCLLAPPSRPPPPRAAPSGNTGYRGTTREAASSLHHGAHFLTPRPSPPPGTEAAWRDLLPCPFLVLLLQMKYLMDTLLDVRFYNFNSVTFPPKPSESPGGLRSVQQSFKPNTTPLMLGVGTPSLLSLTLPFPKGPLGRPPGQITSPTSSSNGSQISLACLLLNLFNATWLSGMFSSAWWHAVTLPIPKPGKDPSETSSYRLISLLSNLGKTLEHIVQDRLTSWLEHKHFLPAHMYGFCPNRGILDALLHLGHHIQEGFNNKRFTSVAFLDLKAFDSASHNTTVVKLVRLGLRGSPHNWVKSFLSYRFFSLVIGNTYSRHYPVTRGGSTQHGLDDVHSWMAHWALTSAQKSSLLYFTQRHIPNIPEVTINGIPRPLQNCWMAPA
ncbi:hypothetical protein O3P69_018446 [Scylla paramamosain]|uniref:Reverse transcriptase domain-containing protein n=1 Tax=Scylla paramamosain TaxID=85552 RepID=A0AAW0T3E6_SCYPA